MLFGKLLAAAVVSASSIGQAFAQEAPPPPVVFGEAIELQTPERTITIDVPITINLPTLPVEVPRTGFTKVCVLMYDEAQFLPVGAGWTYADCQSLALFSRAPAWRAGCIGFWGNIEPAANNTNEPNSASKFIFASIFDVNDPLRPDGNYPWPGLNNPCGWSIGL